MRVTASWGIDQDTVVPGTHHQRDISIVSYKQVTPHQVLNMRYRVAVPFCTTLNPVRLIGMMLSYIRTFPPPFPSHPHNPPETSPPSDFPTRGLSEGGFSFSILSFSPSLCQAPPPPSSCHILSFSLAVARRKGERGMGGSGGKQRKKKEQRGEQTNRWGIVLGLTD